MPVLPIDHKSLFTVAGLRSVQSVMLWPSEADSEAREKYKAMMCVSDLEEEAAAEGRMSGEIQVPFALLRTLRSAPSKEDFDVEESLRNSYGSAAGDVLLHALDLHFLRRLLGEVGEEKLGAIKLDVAQRLGKSVSWLNNDAWREHNAVAHLWAANQLANIVSPERIQPYGPSDGRKFMAMAALLEEYAISYKCVAKPELMWSIPSKALGLNTQDHAAAFELYNKYYRAVRR